MNYVLLTGATGLIGRYLMYDLIREGRNVAVLVRGADAKSRVASVMANITEELGAHHVSRDGATKLVVLTGDLHESDLGLSASDREWMNLNIESVIHSAGEVSFNGDVKDADPWKTNVEGTENLLTYCEQEAIENFSYVSTAFVSGNREGVIKESELDVGQSFGSRYEESKFQAEKLLRSFGFKRLNIFRPCSVTGDSRTGYTSTFHGVYWFAQFTALARMRAGAEPGEPWHHDVRIFNSGYEKHHFIAVDYVSRAIVEINRSSEPGLKTYHLTPPDPIDLRLLEQALSEHYAYTGVTFSECTPREDWNELERLFYEGLQSLAHRYLDGDPSFDCSNTLAALPWWQDVVVDKEYLIKIFEFADQQKFGRLRQRRGKVASAE